MITRISELSKKKYFHGSGIELPVGTILVPQENYEANWQHIDFYPILEKYRPKNMLAHKDAVFMCDNEDDVDLAGGSTEYLFTVVPLGKVEKHDLNWSSEISCLVGDNPKDWNKIKEAADNYWAGVPHFNESVWEYLTPSAKILKVEEY